MARARRRNSMAAVRMTVFRPARRAKAGWVARWIDPATGRRRQKTLDAGNQRDAYREAGDLADILAAGVDPDGMPWLEFCAAYERQALAGRSKTSLWAWRVAKWSVETFAPLRTITEATPVWVARWQEALATIGHRPEDARAGRRPLSPNTRATYAARLRAALRWADRQRLIDRAPYVRVEYERVPRSRAITGEEFDRILAVVPKIRPHDTPAWTRLLRALARTNLRIGELLRLSWDPEGPIRIEWHDGFPLIRKPPKANKTRRDRLEPILPAFWAVCCETPPAERSGPVFPVPTNIKGTIETISRIGAVAGVVTNPDSGKTATSHDIGRRGFLPQVDGILTQPEAHKAMGHANFTTTAVYYDTRTMVSIVAKLWGDRRPERPGRVRRAASGASGGAPANPDPPAETETQRN